MGLFCSHWTEEFYCQRKALVILVVIWAEVTLCVS